jgi:hypothetical protein
MNQKTSAYARSRGLTRVAPQLRRVAVKALQGNNGLTRHNEVNTLFTEAEIQMLLRDPRAAHEAMRTGRGTYNDLVSISSALHKGVAIEDARVIVRGFEPIYTAAESALRTIEARATRTGRWVPTALYAAEINAIDDLLFAYEQALRVCTYGEFYQRQAVALARTASNGKPVFTVGDVVEYPGS